jgi:hypothetical protein
MLREAVSTNGVGPQMKMRGLDDGAKDASSSMARSMRRA